MRLLDVLTAHDRAYTYDCACGGTILLGTDGDGHATEFCLSCGAFTVTPRVEPRAHPAIVAHEQAMRAERVLVEIERAALPFCRTCLNHVTHARGEYCAECAQARRRVNDRLAKRVVKGLATPRPNYPHELLPQTEKRTT
ncbi:MAG: hypothetical protein JWM41_2861 [Gemmatimonadetes bacterium]|nr:hypothetical protein [Gemmatimonadota bacterium]